MITDIEHYFAKGCGRCARFDTADCSAIIWHDGLTTLRDICLNSGLEETVKWGHPCYMHSGRNIAIIGAFREDFRLSFFNAALMKDLQGIVTKQGPNSQYADAFRFTSTQQVSQQAPLISSYIDEAISYAKAGIKAPKQQRDVEIPKELIDALDADPELAEAI